MEEGNVRVSGSDDDDIGRSRRWASIMTLAAVVATLLLLLLATRRSCMDRIQGLCLRVRRVVVGEAEAGSPDYVAWPVSWWPVVTAWHGRMVRLVKFGRER
jgi:hypothetical protein